MSSSEAERCPGCHEPRGGEFCEQCGHRYADPAPSTPSSWVAVVAPDREYFVAGGANAQQFTFPAQGAPQRVPLTAAVVRIGRRSRSRRPTPEIELADPGVSREHARLLAEPDGTWTVVDDGSTNGTYLNDAPHPIPAHRPVPLSDADRIHLGVWTTITILNSHSAGSAGLSGRVSPR